MCSMACGEVRCSAANGAEESTQSVRQNFSVADAQVKRAGGGRDDNSGNSKRRRDRFGGSDGVRLLMGSSLLSTSHSTGDDRLRILGTHSPFHRRRKSDTNFNAMDVGATVAPPAAPAATVAAPATTNKTTVPLARPDPSAKRPFESVVPASENNDGKPKTEEASFMNQIIEGGKTALNDVAKSFTQFIDDMKPTKLECLNGGVLSRNEKECECKMTWTGKRCETMVCFNGGKVIEIGPEKAKVCRCYPEEFISGPHCDTITCQNGGMALADASGCDCNTIYTGKFCESNIFITNAHIGIPALVLFIFLCCCFLCRMDLCPRRPPPSSSTRNASHTRRGHSADRRRQPQGGFRHEQPPLLQPQFPMTAAVAAAAGGSGGGGGAYVIRLDTIPTFNPQMIGGVPIEEGKILEPPPPYDEALNARCTFEPPRYQEQPPEGSQVRGMNGDEGRERRSTPR
eukprot:PDM66901.1 hypothetical protein PRIPAC_48318 [Pristionchus pacificus]